MVALGEMWVLMPSLLWSLGVVFRRWRGSSVVAIVIGGVIVGGHDSILNVGAFLCTVVIVGFRVKVWTDSGLEVGELPPLLFCQLLPQRAKGVPS